MLALIVTLLATAAVTAGQVHTLATPMPVFVPAPPRGMGYYVMQGNKIVSQPFVTAADCTRGLTKLKNQLPVGTYTSNLVCAYRKP